MTSVFTVKFNPEFKLLTQKIQITKVHVQLSKMAGDKALLLTSLVLLLAIFMGRRSFFPEKDAVNVSSDEEDAKKML